MRLIVVRPVVDNNAVESLRERTLSVLSGGTGRASNETLRALDAAIERAVEVAEPCGGYRFARLVDVYEDGVKTMFGAVESTKFAMMARESSGDPRVAFALSTAGASLDAELALDIPLLEKFVLDAVGSELAEIVADMVEAEWKRDATEQGLESSARMSPGYCDWLLQGQSVIFKAIDAEAIGVRLTDSFLMIPAKSVSSAAVLAERVPLRVQCLTCTRADCPFRRAPQDEAWSGARRTALSGNGEEAE